MCLKKYKRESKVKDISFNICPSQIKSETKKGADVWGQDWLIPVAEELEWTFCIDKDTNKQYLVTKLTDYIMGFIPFGYDRYVLELPAGTYNFNTFSDADAVKCIYNCENWNKHPQEYGSYSQCYSGVNIETKGYFSADKYHFLYKK